MPANLPLDRLVRKEVALGLVREILPPQNHIGLQVVAPWLEVESDDVIFDYAKGLTDGLAPARSEDAEAELAQKDFQYAGQGRASIIDWALKDHYSASDVTRYREFLNIVEQLTNGNSMPLNWTGSMVSEFQGKLDRDTQLRRRKLDNRLEWLIMTALETGAITYNDGKIKFTVDYQRPGGQQNQAPHSTNLWSTTVSDPIGDLLFVQQFMYDTYGVRMTRAITSRRVLNSVMNSSLFNARTGLVAAPLPSGGTASNTPINPNYILDGWGPDAAVQVLTKATNIQFIEYDSVYRTRSIGSNTVTTTRFLSDNKIFLLPDEGDVELFDETTIGFAKTLTSPHPMGNWASGFYEWEQETTDPWGYNVGTGVKAFPVFPHMDLTYTLTVL